MLGREGALPGDGVAKEVDCHFGLVHSVCFTVLAPSGNDSFLVRERIPRVTTLGRSGVFLRQTDCGSRTWPTGWSGAAGKNAGLPGESVGRCAKAGAFRGHTDVEYVYILAMY